MHRLNGRQQEATGKRSPGLGLPLRYTTCFASLQRLILRLAESDHQVEQVVQASPDSKLVDQGAVEADMISVLPKVAGQSASGHGAGSTRCPAASELAR